MSPLPDSTYQALRRRARGLLLASLILLLVWIGLLALVDAGREWHQLQNRAGHQFMMQGQAFDLLARDFARHVDDLGRQALDPDVLSTHTAPPWMQRAVQAPRPGGGHTLDDIPEAEQHRTAQLLWAAETPPEPAVLNQLRAFSKAAALGQERLPEVAASYALTGSGQALMIYPWTRSGPPALAQERAAFADPAPGWTVPYRDAAGRGLRVAYVKPLEVDGAPQGRAAAELSLSRLIAPLQRVADEPWQAWLVDVRGALLADRQLGLPNDRIQPAAERLPLPLERLRAFKASGHALESEDGWRYRAQAVEGTPWLLVMAAPERALWRQVLRSLWAYGLIALALVGLWLWALWMLNRQLLRPLIALFGHLEALARDPTAPAPHPPELHPAWRPWAVNVDRLFADWREAQQRQRQAEALKAAVIDHAQIAIIVVDADDLVLEFNPAATALLGFRREQAVGHELHPLICPERFRAGNLAALVRMRADDPDHLNGRALPRRVLHVSGEEIPVELVMWTLSTDGNPLVTLSLRDLREQRAAELVIQQQREALRQSEKLGAMGSLLANVAHELNNPLTIVVGRASLLEEECNGTPAAEDARRLREAAERCGRIVRTFLHMARHRPAKHQSVPLNDLARAAGDLLAYTLRSHDIELEWALSPTLPAVLADPDLLGQVLLNLLINAQQSLSQSAVPHRHILVSTAAEGAWIVLRVQDNGPGVPEALRANIFDPFFTTKGDDQGTGLGLSVSRSIVRDHGGDLVLVATEQGACFELRLPS